MTSLSTEGANKFSAFGWAGGWCYTIHVLPPFTTGKDRPTLFIFVYFRSFQAIFGKLGPTKAMNGIID